MRKTVKICFGPGKVFAWHHHPPQISHPSLGALRNLPLDENSWGKQQGPFGCISDLEGISSPHLQLPQKGAASKGCESWRGFLCPKPTQFVRDVSVFMYILACVYLGIIYIKCFEIKRVFRNL